MGEDTQKRVAAWVAREILPHERDLRVWLGRKMQAHDVDDFVQEAYARIGELGDVSHIRNGRAYLFTTARMLVLEHVRRARIVHIDTVADIDLLNLAHDDPSPERRASANGELALVKRLIETLPHRCRRIFEMRKIEGMPQRDIARHLGVPEHTVENDVAKGLRLILQAMAETDSNGNEFTLGKRRYERARNRKGH